MLLLCSGIINQNKVGDAFEKAVKRGFNHEYRFHNLPLFLTLADQTRFSTLLNKLAQKNRQKPLKRVPRQ